MTLIRLRGLLAEIELPTAALEDTRVRRYIDYLVETANMEPVEARRFAHALLAEGFIQLGDAYAASVQVHVERAITLRTELRSRTEAILRHFEGPQGSVPGELPAHLQPEAFRALFNDLGTELEALRMPPERFIAEQPELIPWEELAREEARVAGEPEAAAQPPDVIMDPLQEPRERYPHFTEAERVERLQYSENLLAVGEDLLARGRAQAAADALIARFPLPENWRYWIRRSPQYGAAGKATRALSALDPVLAAEGYEIVIRTPEGQVFQPDAVAQGPRGFAFAEYKAPLGDQPSGFYNSPAGREQLRNDMLARAAMSDRIPGCGGWLYDTNQAWLDQLLFDLVLELRDSSATADLGRRIFVPRFEGL